MSGHSGWISIRHPGMFALVPAAVNHAAGFPTAVVPAVAASASRTWVTRIPAGPAAIRISGIGITAIVAIMDWRSVSRRTRRRFDHAQDLRRRACASDHVVAGGRYDAISRALAARAKPHCAFLHIELDVAATHVEPELRPLRSQRARRRVNVKFSGGSIAGVNPEGPIRAPTRVCYPARTVRSSSSIPRGRPHPCRRRESAEPVRRRPSARSVQFYRVADRHKGGSAAQGARDGLVDARRATDRARGERGEGNAEASADAKEAGCAGVRRS